MSNHVKSALRRVTITKIAWTIECQNKNNSHSTSSAVKSKDIGSCRLRNGFRDGQAKNSGELMSVMNWLGTTEAHKIAVKCALA